jgi:cyanamide hydratase family protein with HD domain
MDTRPFPRAIAGVAVPQDEVSEATWRWANRALPQYLLAHSVRSYCWGAEIAKQADWTFDRRILWTSALFHDVGLTSIPTNAMCFEVEGAERARRWLERHGLGEEAADRVAIAIILHMQPGVTLDDGVESVLLDRATAVDVRGAGIEAVQRIRDDVVREFPRDSFDRRFLRAIQRESSIRPTCRSAALLDVVGLARWMAESPWAVAGH